MAFLDSGVRSNNKITLSLVELMQNCDRVEVETDRKQDLTGQLVTATVKHTIRYQGLFLDRTTFCG